MAFDKIVGVDGTTYNLPDAVRTKISSNITTSGQQENTAVAAVVAAGITGKANTVHTHTVSQITDLTGIGSIPGVEIGVVGGNGIALQDKHTLVYEGSTSKWRNKVASGGVTVSDTKPSTPIYGDAWFDSNDGTLYVYYYDGNTAQWVQVQANSALEGTILARLGALEGRATALEAVPDYSPNYLLNGNFDIFQRSSFSSQTVAGYSLDRWYVSVAGTTTVSQQTTGVPAGSQYCARIAYNAASSVGNIAQPLESNMVKQLNGKTVTISGKARRNSTFASNLYVILEKNATADTYSGGSWSNVTYIEIQNTSLPTGTTSADWYSFSFTTTIPNDGTANGLRLRFAEVSSGPSGAYYELAQIQLEVGSNATPFRRNANSIQGELAACQRYYYRWIRGNQTSMSWTSNSATELWWTVYAPVTMRRLPDCYVSYSGTTAGTPTGNQINFYQSGFKTGSGTVTVTAYMTSYSEFAVRAYSSGGWGITTGTTGTLEPGPSVYYEMSAEL